VYTRYNNVHNTIVWVITGTGHGTYIYNDLTGTGNRVNCNLLDNSICVCDLRDRAGITHENTVFYPTTNTYFQISFWA